MRRLAEFVSTYPVLTVVWAVGMALAIGFILTARAEVRRLERERLAKKARLSDRKDTPAKPCDRCVREAGAVNAHPDIAQTMSDHRTH